MAIKRTTKADPSFSMSSMTDIVFLLLIFFLVTTTLIAPNALNLLLPKSDSSDTSANEAPVSVFVKDCSEGKGLGPFTYHVNSEDPIDFYLIEGSLNELLDHKDPDQRSFSIYADESVPIKEVVLLMNIAKRNHYKVIMATSPM